MKKYLEITPEMEAEWRDGDYILFDCECGSGKTTAIINMMKRHCDEEMLYLVPRVELLNSIENKISDCGIDNIRVMTLQGFYELASNTTNITKFLNVYKKVCIDEFQQCILDSPFCKTGGDSVSIIVEYFKGITILLTGTDIGTEFLFKEAYNINIKVYSIKPETNDWVKDNTITFIPNTDIMVDIIEKTLLDNEKILFFSSSIKTIDNIINLMKTKPMVVVSKYSEHSDRLCGKDRKDIKELIDTEKIPDEYSVVLSTKAMDVGVNIWDDKVSSIIIDTTDIATAIQQINRKRRKTNEKIKLYFMLPNRYKLAGGKRYYENRVKDYELFKNDITNWHKIHQFERMDGSGIIYVTPDLKTLCPKYCVDYYYLTYAQYLLNTSLKTSFVCDYIKAIEKTFNIKSTSLSPVNNEKLEEFVDILLATKEEKRKLIELFKNVKDYKSATYLNFILEEQQLPYKIKTKLNKELGKRNGIRHACRSGWMLVRTDKKYA